MLAKVGKGLAEIGRNATNIGKCWSKMTRCLQKLAIPKVWHESTNLGRVCTLFGLNRFNAVHMSARIG